VRCRVSAHRKKANDDEGIAPTGEGQTGRFDLLDDTAHVKAR